MRDVLVKFRRHCRYTAAEVRAVQCRMCSQMFDDRGICAHVRQLECPTSTGSCP